MTLSGKEITIAEMDEYLKARMDSINVKGISIVINDGKVVCHSSSANIGSH